VVSNDEKTTGGCLCGAVRYESTAQPHKVGYCHCRVCQRVSGAPVVVGVYFQQGTFRFVKGQPRYYQSSASVERGFCENCGSRLTYRIFGSGSISVEVGSLDHPELTPPEYHIGVESQIPWFEIDDELPRTHIDESTSTGSSN